MLRVLVVASLLLASAASHAAMRAEAVDYRIDGQPFRGHLVYDDAVSSKRPGLLMVPNWYGAGDKSVDKAKALAGKEYVIFVADLFGTAVRPANDAEALAAVKPLYTDRGLMRSRVNAGLAQLRAQAGKAPIDAAKIAAIGFCFGGSAVLDLARSGADIASIVTFHANLSTDDPALGKAIKARVLVLNGADDSMVQPQIAGFESEMRAGKVDWEFINYGGAVHCFTEVGENSAGCRYDEKTAKRAIRRMHDWLGESFAP